MSGVANNQVPKLPSGAVDMTPLAAHNWLDGSPVLFVGPDATVHHKVALAWSLVSELETMAEAACSSGVHLELAQSLCAILWERSTALKALLETLGWETSGRAALREQP